MKDNYLIETQEIKNICKEYRKIYYYNDNPNKYHYERFFLNGQVYLRHSFVKQFNKQAYLYFNTDSEINARVNSNHPFTISVSATLMETCMYELLSKNFFIENPKLSDYTVLNDLLKKKGKISLNHFMFELLTAFVFFHEASHLAQIAHGALKTNAKFDMEEMYLESDNNFNLKLMSMEIDADYVAISKISKTVVSVFESLEQKDKSEELLSKLIVICCSSVYLLFTLLFSQRKNKELYFKKGKHPHPIIRIINMSTSLVSILKNKFNNIYNLNEKQIFLNTTMLVDNIINAESGIYYLSIIKNNENEIDNFFEEMAIEMTQFPFLLSNINYNLKYNI